MAKEIVLPKTLAGCADLLYKTREKRLSEQKKIKELEDLEKALRDHLINNLPKSDATGVAGKVARVKIETETVPTVTDWDALYKHIKKTNSFEFLQRRVNASAVNERWAENKTVPGVGEFTVIKVSCVKA